MQLWIGVYLPHLPLEVFRPTWSSEHGSGLVVLEQDRVLAMSLHARDAGVRPGMRRASVLGLHPGIHFRDRDHALENDALQRLAMALMHYSPQVTLLDQASLLVNVSASLRLFGGIRALHHQVRATVQACGFSARISMAPGGTGAGMLARSGAGHALKLQSVAAHRSLETVLRGLPLTLLPSTMPFIDWFEGLGCKTLGDMLKLPRAGLKRRCGEAFLDALDRALGRSAEWFEWLSVPARFDARQELPDRVDHAHQVLACAAGLVAQLTGWLVAHQLAVTRIVLLLEHERGRHPMPPTALEIALSEPVWHDRHLLRLLTERLGHLELQAAVIAVRLDAGAIEPAAPASATLFPDAGASLTAHRRLLELLQARLGDNSILHCESLPDHRPEIANHWQTHASAPRMSNLKAAPRHKAGTAAPAHAQTHAAANTPPRPAWILSSPIALMVRHHRPFYGSTLRTVSTGERIETGWWDGKTVIRDYFVAQADDHCCYWIFLERDVAPEDDEEPRWFLHGLFG